MLIAWSQGSSNYIKTVMCMVINYCIKFGFWNMCRILDQGDSTLVWLQVHYFCANTNAWPLLCYVCISYTLPCMMTCYMILQSYNIFTCKQLHGYIFYTSIHHKSIIIDDAMMNERTQTLEALLNQDAKLAL